MGQVEGRSGRWVGQAKFGFVWRVLNPVKTLVLESPCQLACS